MFHNLVQRQHETSEFHHQAIVTPVPVLLDPHPVQVGASLPNVYKTSVPGSTEVHALLNATASMEKMGKEVHETPFLSTLANDMVRQQARLNTKSSGPAPPAPPALLSFKSQDRLQQAPPHQTTNLMAMPVSLADSASESQSPVLDGQTDVEANDDLDSLEGSIELTGDGPVPPDAVPRPSGHQNQERSPTPLLPPDLSLEAPAAASGHWSLASSTVLRPSTLRASPLQQQPRGTALHRLSSPVVTLDPTVSGTLSFAIPERTPVLSTSPVAAALRSPSLSAIPTSLPRGPTPTSSVTLTPGQGLTLIPSASDGSLPVLSPTSTAASYAALWSASATPAGMALTNTLHSPSNPAVKRGLAAVSRLGNRIGSPIPTTPQSPTSLAASTKGKPEAVGKPGMASPPSGFLPATTAQASPPAPGLPVHSVAHPSHPRMTSSLMDRKPGPLQQRAQTAGLSGSASTGSLGLASPDKGKISLRVKRPSLSAVPAASHVEWHAADRARDVSHEADLMAAKDHPMSHGHWPALTPPPHAVSKVMGLGLNASASSTLLPSVVASLRNSPETAPLTSTLAAVPVVPSQDKATAQQLLDKEARAQHAYGLKSTALAGAQTQHVARLNRVADRLPALSFSLTQATVLSPTSTLSTLPSQSPALAYSTPCQLPVPGSGQPMSATGHHTLPATSPGPHLPSRAGALSTEHAFLSSHQAAHRPPTGVTSGELISRWRPTDGLQVKNTTANYQADFVRGDTYVTYEPPPHKRLTKTADEIDEELKYFQGKPTMLSPSHGGLNSQEFQHRLVTSEVAEQLAKPADPRQYDRVVKDAKLAKRADKEEDLRRLHAVHPDEQTLIIHAEPRPDKNLGDNQRQDWLFDSDRDLTSTQKTLLDSKILPNIVSARRKGPNVNADLTF
jgi:hypothetical protein